MTVTETFIEHYGLLAVFLGGLLEGETVLILAGVAAHHGILSVSLVFVVSALAAAIGDQFWFLLARFWSDRDFVKRAVETSGVKLALEKIDRHPNAFVLSFRFIYGLRIAGALACGLSRIPILTFLVLNSIAALIWSAVILTLGYAFGSAIEMILGEAKQIEWKLLVAAGLVMTVFVARRAIKKRNEK